MSRLWSADTDDKSLKLKPILWQESCYVFVSFSFFFSGPFYYFLAENSMFSDGIFATSHFPVMAIANWVLGQELSPLQKCLSRAPEVC